MKGITGRHALSADCHISDWNVTKTVLSDHGAIHFTIQMEGGGDALPPHTAGAILHSFKKANWKLYRVEFAKSVS
ncbi:hypothetical protein NESM_000489900 [Novymonas esmeraldas]|uniref:Uncharacterized protein n=1 Tax=Novymonas esmeraldas TaxID=1808958 RepID=A0AAW0ENB3_9TRYP